MVVPASYPWQNNLGQNNYLIQLSAINYFAYFSSMFGAG